MTTNEELYNKLVDAENEGLLKISKTILDDLSSGDLTRDELSGLNYMYEERIRMARGMRHMNSAELRDTLVNRTNMSSRNVIIPNNIVLGGRADYLNGERYTVLNWIYFHGKIETKLGYDIVYINRRIDPKEITSKDSLHLRVININTDDVSDAIGFFWKDSGGNDRGLIVDANDYESIKYAVEIKEKQSDQL